MRSVTIVGGGFSAALAKLRFNKYKLKVISPKNTRSLEAHFTRRRSIEANKLFSKKASSYGQLAYDTGPVKLHDRIVYGGNTNIWGGMVDTECFTKEAYNLLYENNISLREVNGKNNGYQANRNSIKQLCHTSGKILDTSKFFEKEKNQFLHSINVKEDQIILKVFSADKNCFYHTSTDILILGISSPQLIDLLVRSQLLEKKVKIEMDEFDHKFKLSLKKCIDSYVSKKCTVVQFSFLRAVDHYLGSNFFFNYLNFCNIPIYVNQIFFQSKRAIELELDCSQGVIRNKSEVLAGDSAHYCNLKIGGIPINTYIQSISKNIYGVSMPFISQRKPGPISSDIIEKVLALHRDLSD